VIDESDINPGADLEIGGGQADAALLGLEQHIGENRQRLPGLDDVLHHLEPFEERTVGPSGRSALPGRRTFAKLLTDLRREMAPALLRDRHGVSEVAFLLGYEDPSAFRRAFHRWFARSPRSFRRAAE
jgi:AraC-like DNA-binding protein